MPIAESLGLAALGWVASPVIKDLVTKSITYLGSDIAEGLEDLETILLPQFQLTIQAAQNCPHATQLNKWLLRLKNAYYDAEAILHMLEYKRLQHKVKCEQNKTWVRISSYPIIKPLVKFTMKVNRKVYLLSPQKRKLWNRLNKLKKIAAEAETVRELLAVKSTDGNKTPVRDTRPATSAFLTDKVFGLDGIRNDIIDFLLEEKELCSLTSRHTVVAITGVGGAGKTTLARYVYNDQKMEDCFGARRMWVCLSKNRDIMERTKEMIECISGEKCPDLLNFNFVQKMLKEKLSNSGQILLVLDDVWYDDSSAEEEQWDILLTPFSFLGRRCKIIITSRSQRFPIALLPGKHIQLRDLAHNDFLDLFRYYAGLESSNSKLNNDLSVIGDQIAEKMNRSPLAAKVIGNQLQKRPNKRFWQDTLLNVDLNNVREVLLWSYQCMDVQLQRCFLLCAVYPQGSRYSRTNMMALWVALDFVQPALDDTRTVEDIGFQYFDMLVANSIFELVNGKYVMHDPFHDLAEKLSAGDCFRVTNHYEKRIPATTILHMFLTVNNDNWKEKLSSICHLSNLHTLILGNQLIGDVSEILKMISTYFKNLRVLDIGMRGWKTLPGVAGDLRNLRYLMIGHSSIEELPYSIYQLYHLQFLLLPSSVKNLPMKLSNLIKLKNIVMVERNGACGCNLPPVTYLGKLTSLQTLPEFHVRKEEGYELQQLGHLLKIGGPLRIVGLENVRDKDEAVAARLNDKSKLTWLTLVWTGLADSIGSEVEVIEALQPSTNLQKLTIDGYTGTRYPTWLQEGSALPNLKSLGFSNCAALKVLPSNFSQFHCCTELILYNLGALRELPPFPENLARLKIIECPCLILARENESELQVDEFQGIVESGFLTSADCPWEAILDNEVKSFAQTGLVEHCLEHLEIIRSAINGGNYAPTLWGHVNRAWWHCHQQRTNFIFGGLARSNKLKLTLRLCFLHLSFCCITNRTLLDGLRGMAFLQELQLAGIMTITTLPTADVLKTLRRLQHLRIYHCWCLRSVGGLHALPHLQTFHVEGCWHLEMKNDDCAPLPPSLQSVIFKGSIISENILHANFLCLQNVEIYDC